MKAESSSRNKGGKKTPVKAESSSRKKGIKKTPLKAESSSCKKGSKKTSVKAKSSAVQKDPAKGQASTVKIESPTPQAQADAALQMVESDPTTPPQRRKLVFYSPPPLPVRRRSTPLSPVCLSLGSMSPLPCPKDAEADTDSEVTGLADSAMRRPSAAVPCLASRLRKPASQGLQEEKTVVLKKPSAEVQGPAQKKPAAHAGAAKRRNFRGGDPGPRERGLPRQLQEKRREGCGRCRGRRGCTDACWKSRGYLL